MQEGPFRRGGRTGNRRGISPLLVAAVAVLGAVLSINWRWARVVIASAWFGLRGRLARYRRGIRRDIAYGAHPRHRLDVYVPPGAEDAPVVIFAHGGSFYRFNKEVHALVGTAFRQRGFVAVLPNYRLHPEIAYPAFVDDLASVVHWVQANIAQHGGDPARIVLVGHSAGGIMASLLALDGERYGLAPGALRGLVSLSALYDYEHPAYMTPLWLTIMGGGESFHGPAQPLAALRRAGDIVRSTPPLLVIHGKNDHLIPLTNARRFVQAAEAAGLDVRFVARPRTDHYRPVFQLGNPGSDLMREVAAFARACTTTPAQGPLQPRGEHGRIAAGKV